MGRVREAAPKSSGLADWAGRVWRPMGATCYLLPPPLPPPRPLLLPPPLLPPLPLLLPCGGGGGVVMVYNGVWVLHLKI